MIMKSLSRGPFIGALICLFRSWIEDSDFPKMLSIPSISIVQGNFELHIHCRDIFDAPHSSHGLKRHVLDEPHSVHWTAS